MNGPQTFIGPDGEQQTMYSALDLIMSNKQDQLEVRLSGRHVAE